MLFSFISIYFYDVDNSYLISTFALFGAAAFRIIPSFSRLLSNLQDIKFSKSAQKIIEQDIIYFDQNLLEKQKNLILDTNKNSFNEINLKNINFSYGDKEIFNNLDLTIKNKKF